MEKIQRTRLDEVTIRRLEAKDNAGMAQIIRSCLTEFGVDKPGTVFTDPTTDDLHRLFRQDGSWYFIAEHEGRMLGGGGIFPSAGLPSDTCELVKMYLVPDAREIGLGWKLIGCCIEKARSLGYGRMYIETMPELKKAISVYRKFGFREIPGPMGDTGHFGCDVWMLLDLQEDRTGDPAGTMQD